jgi:hypothetical protein
VEVCDNINGRYIDALVAQRSARFAKLLQFRLLAELDQALTVQYLRKKLTVLPNQARSLRGSHRTILHAGSLPGSKSKSRSNS